MGYDKLNYYSYNKIKSYQDVTYYIVATERGIGKTYSEIQSLFKHYIRDGFRFACIYRTGKDLERAVGTWLSPLVDPGPLDKIKPVNLKCFRWRISSGYTSADLLYKPLKSNSWTVIGYFRTLAGANAVKQEKFPLDIREIFFDEAVPVEYKKIAGVVSEGEAVELIKDTMAHDMKHPKHTMIIPKRKRALYHYRHKYYPKIKVVIVFNPRYQVSPLLGYFHLNLTNYGCYKINRDVAYERLLPEYENTDGGLSNNARKCIPMTNEQGNIKRIPKNSIPYMSIRLHENYYVMYSNLNNITVIKRAKKHTKGCRRYYGTLDYLTDSEDCIEYQTRDGKIRNLLVDRITSKSDYFASYEVRQSYLYDLGLL